MPHREQFVNGNLYHIFSRGNNRETIFPGQSDYYTFLKKFGDRVTPDIAELHGWVLIPNHYHILARVVNENQIAKKMQAFGISYAKSINLKYGRVGHLFQGRYGVRRVHSDGYLLNLSRYIHLNPVIAGLVKIPEQWEFSSYKEFISDTSPHNPRFPIVNTDFTLSIIGGAAPYRESVEEYLVRLLATSRKT